MEIIYKWNKKIPMTKYYYDLELETLTYFIALSSVYDYIMSEHHETFNNEENSIYLQQLHTSLRQIKKIEVLCLLMEDIFQLFFTRWEHLGIQITVKRKNSTATAQSPQSSSPYSPVDDDENTKTCILVPNVNGAKLKQGFICSGEVLYKLLVFLKNFLTKKLHGDQFKQSYERIREKFQRILDLIAEGIWKYDILKRIDEQSSNNLKYNSLNSQDLMYMVQLHSDSIQRNSSDDESRERNYGSINRRKVSNKKRRRATFSGTNVKTELQVVNRNSMQACSALTSEPLKLPYTQRSIIQKMLISPENLATLALALKNFEDVKHIMASYKLQNSDLQKELSYMEQQEITKQKLKDIYDNYERQIQSTNMNQSVPMGTVEQIRNVAVKGFEVSKIINVIDNFAQAQRLTQSQHIEAILNKHQNNYAFLQQFQNNRLNAIVVADLIMGLPFNFEITSSILMVIKRQQQLAFHIKSEPEAESSASNSATMHERNNKTHLPHNIGVMPFLENLCECMRLMEKEKSLTDVLTNNYYSLRPQQLSMELKRQKAFKTVYQHSCSEFTSYENLKALMPQFHNLQSKNNYFHCFQTYIMHLIRLQQMADKNLVYHLNTLLKLDPYTVIGDLLFQHGLTPLELEANVQALNLKLVHVIAINLSQNIGDPSKMCSLWKQSNESQHKHELESIFNYICQQNCLLGYLLKCILDLNDIIVNDADISTEYMSNFIDLPEVEILSKLYHNNNYITALNVDQFNAEMLEKIPLEQQLEILKLQFGFFGKLLMSRYSLCLRERVFMLT